MNHKPFDCGLTQRSVNSEKSIITTFVVLRPWKHVISQYAVYVTNSYLVDHGYFGAGLYRDYRTRPGETSEVQ